MNSNYAACLKIILQNEGGYVNNPHDPGGETNYGITKNTARSNGYTGSMHDIPMSVVESIYRKKFWVSSSGSCDDLPAGVDLVVFDYAVNSGPGRAWPAYKTHKADPVTTIKAVCVSRLAFLKSLHTWSTFGPGWQRRVERVQSLALKMANQPVPATPRTVPATPAPTPAPKPTTPAPTQPQTRSGSLFGMLVSLLSSLLKRNK